MLGDKIVENERGRVISTRVLAPDGPLPRTELTFQTTARILGFDATNMGTVVTRVRAGGALFSEGTGVVATNEGDLATWTFQGILTPMGPYPAAGLRGSVFFETQSDKLARLNTLCAVVEANVDADGNMSAELWQWL